MKYTIIVLILAACSRSVPVTRVGENALWGCGTYEAARAYWKDISRDRPEPGPKFVYSEHIVVHFDTIGQRATSRAYAESVAVYAEEAWRVQIDSLGQTPPPPDDGRGGDDRYDIYVWRMEHLAVRMPEWLDPRPGRTDTIHSSFILVKHDIDDWCILRRAVGRRFGWDPCNAKRRVQGND